MSLLFLDCETIPRQDLSPNPSMVKAPANYKKEEAIKKYQEEHAEEAYRKLALDPFGAQIIVIAAAWNDGDIVSFYGEDERQVIFSFNMWLASLDTNTPAYARGLCGFNIANFDAPMLYLRGCKYGAIHVSDITNKKPFDEQLYDVMRMAFPTKRNEYVSMDVLCRFFGMEGKEGIDGSMVYDMYKAGKIEEIRTYCESDVDKTRQLYNILK